MKEISERGRWEVQAAARRRQRRGRVTSIGRIYTYYIHQSSIIHIQHHESQDSSWHAVASWTWDAHDDACGICRMAFDGCCPDCKMPGDDCPLIWGACNHAFHLHCILKWVNSQSPRPQCPMCRREWKFREA
ncbi:hypothetical protein O6H91_19G082400 [Diphasiastrum complanatum]|uniref:Uncharacterized protein n=1 Tax=Diphasiastrum complanatum TaxID=34168 RepID=A0ACC2AWY5_DIPCM|nr:hypothetical protein O6H91_19G082400 [Diphasiastrum complanatum]